MHKIWMVTVHILSGTYINILGGEPIVGDKIETVEQNEYPFIVSIAKYIHNKEEQEKNHLCGGVLIGKKYVLTAAHCVKNILFKSSLRVYFGSSDLKSDDMRYCSPKSWTTYTEWVTKTKRKALIIGARDAAIIELDCDDTGITPATISPLETKKLYGTTVSLVGWGVTNSGLRTSILKRASVQVLSKERCRERVNLIDQEVPKLIDHESYICAAAEPFALGGCGDSGSPYLDTRNRVVAIHQGKCPALEHIIPDQVNIGVNTLYLKRFIGDITGKLLE